jgi:hypothetical protein
MNPMNTIGISPKLVWAVIAAVCAQVLADPLLELPAWADYVIQAVATAAAAYIAPPGNVAIDADDISDATRNPRVQGEGGYGLVELAIALLIIAVALVVILRIA